MEGENATIECGTVIDWHRVKWTAEGRRLTNDRHKVDTLEPSVVYSKLQIHNVSLSDADVYKCIDKSRSDTLVDTISLIVVSERIYCDVHGQQYPSVTLDCYVSCTGTATDNVVNIKWFVNHNVYTEFNAPCTNKSIKTSVRHDMGRNDTLIQLKINDQFEWYRFVSPIPFHETVSYHADTYTVSCHAGNTSPECMIEWIRDDRTLTNENVLQLDKTYRGDYKCVMSCYNTTRVIKTVVFKAQDWNRLFLLMLLLLMIIPLGGGYYYIVSAAHKYDIPKPPPEIPRIIHHNVDLSNRYDKGEYLTAIDVLKVCDIDDFDDDDEFTDDDKSNGTYANIHENNSNVV